MRPDPDFIRAINEMNLENVRQHPEAEKRFHGLLALIAWNLGELAAQVAELNENFHYPEESEYGAN